MSLTHFIPKHQHRFIKTLMQGEEGDFYKQKLTDLASLISTIPKTYEQDGSPDPIIHLHYFCGGSDWYITEKDSETKQLQAFGYVILNGNEPELGYIPITELIQSNRVELDLYFTPTPASQIPKLADLFQDTPPTPDPSNLPDLPNENPSPTPEPTYPASLPALPAPAPASDSEQAPALITSHSSLATSSNIIPFPTSPKLPLTQRFPYKS